MVTLKPGDIGRFRTPSLRNVALTAPYMHEGSVPTLAEAVEREIYYRGLESGRPLVLTPQEKADLVAFLEALTSDGLASLERTHPPLQKTSPFGPAGQVPGTSGNRRPGIAYHRRGARDIWTSTSRQAAPLPGGLDCALSPCSPPRSRRGQGGTEDARLRPARLTQAHPAGTSGAGSQRRSAS